MECGIELVQAAAPPVTLCMCCAAEEVQSLKAGDSGLDLALAARPFLACTGVADRPMPLACADRVQGKVVASLSASPAMPLQNRKIPQAAGQAEWKACAYGGRAAPCFCVMGASGA